jgi:uncharacterized protein (TIGR02391 family)
MNYKLIAIQVGDLLKYDSTINDINRAANSVFGFNCDSFPNESITSVRAKSIYDWILSLAREKMNNVERNKLLMQFIDLISPDDYMDKINEILEKAGVEIESDRSQNLDFYNRNFHSEICKHCLKLYSQKNYFHAVFEAAKVYNKKVQQKAQSKNDGQALMMAAWTASGVLKLTACKSDTDKNVQEGIKFLSAGLMQAMRNPTAHEPALDWPISKEDCLDMLSFISYLFRQLDKAVYFHE